MLTTRKTKMKSLFGFLACLLIAPALSANAATGGIHINGIEMTPQQLAVIEQILGFELPPGHYLAQGGCIAHLESGQAACSQLAQVQNPAYGADLYGYGNEAYGYDGGAGGGYGYDNGAGGSWFHRGSDYSGGYSVGSDGTGCIYTPNWSNC